MPNTQLISMDQLFHTLGFDYRSLSENEWVDISDKNVTIKSFNHLSNSPEMKKILKLVRKSDSMVYNVKTKQNEILFRCTGAHRVFLQDQNKYENVENLKSFIALTSSNQIIECEVEKTLDICPILDIEVEGNQNYFSNGILSHNTTTAGEALKYYASLRMEVSKKEDIKKGEEVIGVKTKVKIVKNKVSAPFTEAIFDLIFKEGYDFEGSVIESAVKYELIQKGGSWYTFKGERFQGAANLKAHIKSTPGLVDELRSQIMIAVQTKGFVDKEVILTEEVPKRKPVEVTQEVAKTEEINEVQPEESTGTGEENV